MIVCQKDPTKATKQIFYNYILKNQESYVNVVFDQIQHIAGYSAELPTSFSLQNINIQHDNFTNKTDPNNSNLLFIYIAVTQQDQGNVGFFVDTPIHMYDSNNHIYHNQLTTTSIQILNPIYLKPRQSLSILLYSIMSASYPNYNGYLTISYEIIH